MEPPKMPYIRLPTVSVFLLCLLTGCGGSQKIRISTPVTQSSTAAEQFTDHSESSSEAQQLAEQSRRDVELLLGGGNSSTGVDDAREAIGEVEAPLRPRRVVVWDDPPPHFPNSPTSDVESPVAAVTGDQPRQDSEQTSVEMSHEAPALGAMGSSDLEKMKELMADLARDLYASGASSATPLRELLVIAALSVVDPQRALEPEAIPDLTESERRTLDGLTGFFDHLSTSLADANDPEQSILDAVDKLRQTLVTEPTLEISTAALCTRVGGFGDFHPFDRFAFLAHTEQKLIVYLEIDQFTSALNDKNDYVTELSQQLTIYSDRDGIPVWKEDWQSAVDVSRNKRHDFFTVQVITLPKALSVGKYQFKIRVRDEKSSAEAEDSIPFEMVADARLAAATN